MISLENRHFPITSIRTENLVWLLLGISNIWPLAIQAKEKPNWVSKTKQNKQNPQREAKKYLSYLAILKLTLQRKVATYCTSLWNGFSVRRTKSQHGAGLQARGHPHSWETVSRELWAVWRAKQKGGMICFKSTRKNEVQTKHTESRLTHLGMSCYCLKSRKVTGNLGSCLWWLVCLGWWHWLPSHCLSLFQRLGLCGLPARMDSGRFRIRFPE